REASRMLRLSQKIRRRPRNPWKLHRCKLSKPSRKIPKPTTRSSAASAPFSAAFFLKQIPNISCMNLLEGVRIERELAMHRETVSSQTEGRRLAPSAEQWSALNHPWKKE